MDKLLASLRISISHSTYKKDPESSDLGKKIIEESISMIDSEGFESFTFKKLGDQIQSNESSIYRYFENKHKLLLYLCSWYWGWIEYNLVLSCYSISDPKEKLFKAIEIISREVCEDSTFTFINEPALFRIIINENAKSFLTKKVDEENKQGGFESYKRLINRINEMILAVCPTYPFAKSLANSIVEISLNQYFVRDHFKSITDKNYTTPKDFILDLVQKTLV